MRFLRKYHRWAGLIFAFFIMMFAWSGIVMNHRRFFSGVDVPRGILPKEFRYDNWNNAAVKGSLKLSADSILLYGGAGIWLTDSVQGRFTDFTSGIRKGADNRIVSRIVETPSGGLFAATTFGLYRWDGCGEWLEQTRQAGIRERLADVEVRGDTLAVLTRSHLFFSVAPYDTFHKVELPEPPGYEAKTSIFRAMWLLHSGQLFGTAGKLFVDLLGLLLIAVAVTGIVYFFSPGAIKRLNRRKKPVKKAAATMKSSMRWHNRIGVWFLLFFIVLSLSGMFLRPPLLIAVIRSKVPNIPGTALSAPNPWNDKLRTIRYNPAQDSWLIYTSDGFYSFAGIGAIPERVAFTPPVSVMGVTVLEPTRQGWLVGSFTGLYYWNTERDMAFDCYSGQPVTGRKPGRPVSSNPVSGYSGDFAAPVVFEYGVGARDFGGGRNSFAPMPQGLGSGRMSLWHLALEVHTGRIYGFLIGSLTDWFIPISGLTVLLVLISGYCVYRSRNKKRKTGAVANKDCIPTKHENERIV